ncbi:Protein_kinase-like domain superfamily [Hexamita inflata]|uniref:Protein kinase-like domain superfamily n=1 Tax=Hexamita inflata TaxID=28002 RepID=A0AA86U4V4_9EUKA|nr:Protein kinase-like domain superfamily [Hexamita inflata]
MPVLRQIRFIKMVMLRRLRSFFQGEYQDHQFYFTMLVLGGYSIRSFVQQSIDESHFIFTAFHKQFGDVLIKVPTLFTDETKLFQTLAAAQECYDRELYIYSRYEKYNIFNKIIKIDTLGSIPIQVMDYNCPSLKWLMKHEYGVIRANFKHIALSLVAVINKLYSLGLIHQKIEPGNITYNETHGCRLSNIYHIGQMSIISSQIEFNRFKPFGDRNYAGPAVLFASSKQIFRELYRETDKYQAALVISELFYSANIMNLAYYHTMNYELSKTFQLILLFGSQIENAFLKNGGKSDWNLIQTCTVEDAFRICGLQQSRLNLQLQQLLEEFIMKEGVISGFTGICNTWTEDEKGIMQRFLNLE